MKILKRDPESGWIDAVIQGRWVQAKVYNEPSVFGVNECRVSKLCIARGKTRDKFANYLDQMCYNYDRGLDFHEKENLTDKKLQAILAELNALPLLDIKE